MSKIGILAYGSLIEDPGVEIQPLIRDRKAGIETPFRIEFSRSSTKRDGAPTVVPVDKGGSHVQATVLILDDEVSLEEAEDMLWRRETRNECSGKRYTRPSKITQNSMTVEKLEGFCGLNFAIYTKLPENIRDINAQKLAYLAIESAKREAGKNQMDGISYLISLKRQGIATPLMPAYENEILKALNVSDLQDALATCNGEVCTARSV